MSWCFQNINLIWKSFIFYHIFGRSEYLYRSSWEEGLILANFNTTKSPLVRWIWSRNYNFLKARTLLCKSLFRGPEKLSCRETSTLSTFWSIRHEWNEHGTCSVTFIKNKNRRLETFFVISHASTMFSHKVIFPVDNNIKKFGNICSKMKMEAAFEYM